MGVDLLNMFLDCSSDNLKHPGGQPMVNNGMQFQSQTLNLLLLGESFASST